MADRKAADVVGRLTGKFGLKEERKGKHVFYSRNVQDVGMVTTHFSHGEKTIGPVLLGIIAGQLRVTASYFREMLDCSKSSDQWIKQIGDSPVGPMARFHKPKPKQ